jgi:putative two-component system response regulator
MTLELQPALKNEANVTNNSILLVDDNPLLLSGARMSLEMKGFRVITAKNGREALQVLEQVRPDLIVSDVMMPECDGFALLEQIRTHPEWITIPFLFLTALNDPESLKRGRELGADDYLTKPFSPIALIQAVSARLERAHTLEAFHTTEAYLQTITVMARAIEGRDRLTGEHIERVSIYAQDLARGLGWKEAQMNEVRLAAIVHDVGKVIVPDAVLNKPGKLTEEEWQIMKTHPTRGAEIIASLKQLGIILDGVMYHHERYDGKGYPTGLAGEKIPLIGRMLAVVDAFDTMTHDRPYRKGMSHSAAVEQLRLGADSQFDPHMVNIFIRLTENA